MAIRRVVIVIRAAMLVCTGVCIWHTHVKLVFHKPMRARHRTGMSDGEKEGQDHK